MKQIGRTQVSFSSWAQRLVLGVAAAVSIFGASSAHAAAGGSRATAVSISMRATAQSKTVALVEDPEWGDGVYYFKVSLKNGTGYTFWSTGSTSVMAYMGTWDAEAAAVNWDFSSRSALDSVNFWLNVYPDDWWEEMASGTYYLVVQGEPGASFTLNWVEGVVEEPVPIGTEDNPATITVGASEGSSTASLYDGIYYYKATLAAGSKYKFWTAGGNAANFGFALSVSPLSDVVEPDIREGDWTDDYNASVIVVPSQTGVYSILVSGDGNSRFTLKYQVVSTRPPAAHASELLAAPTLETQEAGVFLAGARNNPDSGYFDQVIDEQLFRVNLAKGDKVAFETTGEEAPDGLVMEVYDAKGAVLFANRHKAPGDSHTLVAFQAPATATYWVGVCQDVEEPTNSVSFALSYRKLGADEAALQDAWDTGDDASLGASALSPLPGSAGGEGVGHGPHTLSLTDWADWFRIDARQGVSYELRAAVTNDMLGLVLAATVYSVNGLVQTPVLSIPDLAAGGTFTAPKHGSYYLRVYVQDGQGVEYAYELKSLAYKSGVAQLGLLQVNIGGPTAADGGLWSLVADGASAPKYPGGSTVLLPPGAYAVKFNAVTGWSTPANLNATVVAGAEPAVVTANYNDTSDPKDDIPATATALTPTNKAQRRSHSLWTADAADWFKFTVKPGTYYTFALEPFTGAPWLTVFLGNLTDVVAEGESVRFLAEAAGTYYVKVGHADPGSPTDSAYTLNYLAQTVGAIKFDKAAYTFKEGIPMAELKVLRSAKDGRVRVRYATAAGTALPGVDYKPAAGYLEWPDGNNTTKAIQVPLIPNLYATWESNKTFTVQLDVVPAEELDEGELVPMLAAPSLATVTLTEITKKAPGKLGFVGHGPDEGSIASFAVPARPSVAVNAGSEVTFWVARTGGADGVVAVKAETLKGTALADVNFAPATEMLVWEAGDLSPKPFTVFTIATDELFQKEKALTVKLTVNTSLGGAATLGTATATILIRDPQVSRTVEEWASSEDRPAGLTVKPSVPSDWFFDVNNMLRCVPLAPKAKAELSLTVTGPGLLTLMPELVRSVEDLSSDFKGAIGASAFSCASGEQIVKYLPKGVQTVKLTVTRGAVTPEGEPVYGLFGDVDGQPFKWEPLPAAVPVSPLDKALVGADMEFYWTASAGETFRFYAADSAANLTRAPMIAEFVYGHEFCPGCGIYSFEPGKTYYWRVDAVLPGEDAGDPAQDLLTNVGQVRSFTVAAEGAPVTVDLVSDALSAFMNEAGDGYQLIQGVSYRIGPFYAFEGETFKASNLPAGMALVTTAGESYLVGVPTKTNAVVSSLQASLKIGSQTVAGTTMSMPFTIVPLGLAAGTFNGILRSDAVETNAHETVAGISVTVTEAGKLTAKVLVAGKTYAFAATGYAGQIADLMNGQPGLLAELLLKSVTAGVTYTNTLTLMVGHGPADDPLALDTLAVAALNLRVPSANGQSARELVYEGSLVRDNSKVAAVASALKTWAGYYTVSLPVVDAFEGAPQGAGYVAVTLDVRGAAKIAGVLADGTAWSASGVPGYVSDYGGSGAPALLIPVYTAKGQLAAGGWLEIAADDESGLPVAAGQLAWFNADAKSTRDGAEGYGLTLEPVGGYYDTLFSLQTYYLNDALTVGEMTGPAQYDATYTQLLCWPGSDSLTLNVVGNDMTTDKRALARSAANPAAYDFANSVNPNNLTFVFKRATGLFSGTFSLWYGNAAGTLQKEQTGLKFQGVLTPAKRSGGYYAQNPGLGFYQIPEKIGARVWVGSYLFSVDAQPVVHDWSEGWDAN